MQFELKPPPHALPTTSVPRMMRHVIYALAPAALAHVWFFGWGICINALIATAAALGAEALMLRLRNRPVKPSLLDGTATVTAVLLAFAIPPLAPWWVPVIGAVAAIVLAKHLYGGLGSNLFNPAMVGYAILLISFPVEMTYWLPPRGLEPGLAVHWRVGQPALFPDRLAYPRQWTSTRSPRPRRWTWCAKG